MKNHFYILTFIILSSLESKAASEPVRVVFQSNCAFAFEHDGELVFSSSSVLSERTFEALVQKCKSGGGTHLFKSFQLREMPHKKLFPNSNAPKIGKDTYNIVVKSERATEQNSRKIETKDDALVKEDGSI